MPLPESNSFNRRSNDGNGHFLPIDDELITSIDYSYRGIPILAEPAGARTYPLEIHSIFDVAYFLTDTEVSHPVKDVKVIDFLLNKVNEGKMIFCFTGASTVGKTTAAQEFNKRLSEQNILYKNVGFEISVFKFRDLYSENNHFLKELVTEPYNLNVSFLEWPKSVQNLVIQDVAVSLDKAFIWAQNHKGIVTLQTVLVNGFDRNLIDHIAKNYHETAVFSNFVRDPKAAPIRANRRQRIVEAKPFEVIAILHRELGTIFEELRYPLRKTGKYHAKAVEIGKAIQQKYRQSAPPAVAEKSSQILDQNMYRYAADHVPDIVAMLRRLHITNSKIFGVRQSDIVELAVECAYIEHILLDCGIPLETILLIMNPTIRTAFVAAGLISVDENFFR